MSRRLRLPLVLAACAVAVSLQAQVTFERVLQNEKEPHNWLSYSGALDNQRYSRLTQITPGNVKNLQLSWVWQNRSLEKFEATPLVVDGVMYTVQPPNDIVALDAATGRPFWTFTHTPAAEARACCGRVNRGLAILGDTLYMGTLDARLVAVDSKSGQLLWNTQVADAKTGYSITMSPNVVKDKVIIGTGGGDGPIRGYIAAFDAKTGKELWRFYTIPGPGEKGHDTWSDDSWKSGGASVWVTPSYDPALNLTYWGVGNPGPDFNPDQRPGDNLYSDSVVALDPDTGALKWHFQFSPHDPYDYDSVQVGVLADLNWKGTPTKAILWGNRNGFFYVLDRTNGKFLSAMPFVKVNWASGIDEKGRPIPTPQPAGQPTWPGVQGGTNWYSPSYSPRTGLFYLSAWDGYASVFKPETSQYVPGRNFLGGGAIPFAETAGAPGVRVGRATPINNWTDAAGNGAVIAIDPLTGQKKWTFKQFDVTDSGNLTTATDLLFTGGREGYFYALDARTGAELWKASLGGQIANGPMTYAVDGKQYVAVISGNSLITFALRD